jgi:hypothetical protein
LGARIAVVERIEVDGTAWEVDVAFLSSSWRCVWGETCRGIGEVEDPSPFRGCCTLGAEFTDVDDAANVAAAAACLDPDIWSHHDHGADHGIFLDDSRGATAVVDGACIFLNPDGFSGGAGCALHLGATRHGEPPRDWKPNVCWQLPVKVEWTTETTATVRRWSRADFGEDGTDMAWFCTEDDGAFVGDRPVIDSLAPELRELLGDRVVKAITRHLGGG